LKAVVFYLFLLSGFYGFAQMDCILGVGGRDNETITKVFELTEEQQENLKSWSAELKVRNDILKDKAKYLMKKNEKSSPEVLLTVSKEYGSIMDSMKRNVRMIDKRLLTSFNKAQYERYVKLCSQLALRPIHINRSVDEN
jgi:translation initiation factor 2 alpha subunit (eIF-2alpha)